MLVRAILLGGLLLTATANAAEPRYGELYDADGAAETYAFCITCHSERIVIQQGLTREEWAELLDWMVDEQGMSEIPEPAYSKVLDYLSAEYGPDRPHFSAP